MISGTISGSGAVNAVEAVSVRNVSATDGSGAEFLIDIDIRRIASVIAGSITISGVASACAATRAEGRSIATRDVDEGGADGSSIPDAGGLSTTSSCRAISVLSSDPPGV